MFTDEKESEREGERERGGGGHNRNLREVRDLAYIGVQRGDGGEGRRAGNEPCLIRRTGGN